MISRDKIQKRLEQAINIKEILKQTKGQSTNDIMSQKATTDFVNNEVEKVIEVIEKSKGICYGFHVNSSDSNPYTAVTYIEDAVGMTPAYMDYVHSKFEYGSWKNAFFMPRPCMLKTNGQVAYYLSPNDYTKKEDGTASDVANTSFDGNAMMEWGQRGKRIWYKIVADVGSTTSYSVYIADHQRDSKFVCWSFFNKDNEMMEHFYTPIYKGSLDANNKLRSLSGQSIMNGQTGTQEIAYAQANGSGYNIEVFADKLLTYFLCYLMGKSLNLQATFGEGHSTGGSSAASFITPGALDDKGLFFGYNDGSHKVKVFGMEDQWAEQWSRTAGLILDNGTYYYKLTEGTADGSTATSYPTSVSTGMISAGASPTSSGYVSAFAVHDDVILPSTIAGGSSTYYCDYFYQNQSGVRFALLGGGCNDGSGCGFCVSLAVDVSYADWNVGASLSYKPSSSPIKATSVDYVTTTPTSANTDGMKFAVLSSEPATKYNGWFYVITEE